MHKLLLRTVGLLSVFGLAACGQTYTAADGTTQTSKVPSIVMDVDRTVDVFENNILDVTVAKPGSKYYRSIAKVEATGFKSGMFSAVYIPVDNAHAVGAITKQLTRANLISSKGKYTLHVDLDKAWLEGGTVLLVNYSVLDGIGQEVASFSEQSKFLVPFKAAPIGSVRGELEFIGSITNNVSQFSKRLK